MHLVLMVHYVLLLSLTAYIRDVGSVMHVLLTHLISVQQQQLKQCKEMKYTFPLCVTEMNRKMQAQTAFISISSTIINKAT